MGKKNKKNKNSNKNSNKNIYFSELHFPKENNQHKVYANTPEQGAKKLYKMFKRLYSENGYVKVLSESKQEEWIFPITWTNPNNNKFISNKK